MSMTTILLSNQISGGLPPDSLDRAMTAIRIVQDELAPKLVELGPDERKALPKIGSKTLDFIAKALEHMRANPELKPGFVDLDEMARDLAAVSQLRTLLAPLKQIVDLLDDSLMLSAGEAYAAALVCYQAAKSAARLNTPGAKVIVDDLALQFARQGRSDRADPPEPPPAPANP
jgi:hypothetical protein